MNTPSLNGPVTATRAVCAGPLPAGPARTTCSDRCRQAAWRSRHQPPAALPRCSQPAVLKHGTVYECPDCKLALSASSAVSAGPSCAGLAPAGYSPCCGEVITVEEMLEN